MYKTRQAFIRKSHRDYLNVNIEIKDSQQIFQGYGYRSSEQKLMNKDLERYIFNSVSSYPLGEKIRLILNITDREGVYKTDIEEVDIHSYFSEVKEESERELNQQVKHWRINMLIGILFLVLCLILVEVLAPFSYINIIKILKESLMIIGWVALWEPVTFLLFGWRTLKRKNLYYRKLCNIPVIINSFNRKK